MIKSIFSFRNFSIACYTLSIVLALIWHFYFDGGFEPFTVLPLFVLSLAGYLLNKHANNINHELFSNFQNEINEAENLFISYFTRSCIKRLDEIQKRIDTSTLTGTLGTTLKARAFYLKGQCYSHIGDNDNGFPCFLQAASLKTDIKYLERKCTITYHAGEENNALEIANDILEQDPLNPRANAIKLIIDKNFDIESIHPFLKTDKTFNQIFGNIVSKQYQINIDKKLIDLESIIVPDTLSSEDYHYWVFILSHSYSKFLQENPLVYSKPNPDKLNSSTSLISNISSISEIILNATKNSELIEQSQTLKSIEFISLHIKYLLYQDSNIPNKMVKVITQEGYVISENEFITTIALLGKVKLPEMILNFKNHDYVKKLNLEVIFALACVETEAKDEAISFFKGYIQGLNLVQRFAVKNITLAIEYFRLNDINTSDLFDNQLATKKYEYEVDKLLINIACKKDHIPNEELKKLILSPNLEHKLLSIENKEYLCLCLNQIGEFDESNKLLMDDLDISKESLMSYLYLDNLYKNRSQYDDLIKGLEYWRLNHAPVFILMTYEIELQHTLRNYEKLEEVCNYGLVHYQSYKTTLIYYLIIALNGESHKIDTLKKLLNEDALSCDFSWQMAFHVARICLNHEFYEIGFELAYRKTKSRPDNIQIKQHYFALVAQFLDSSKITDPGKVELDSSVILIGEKSKHIIHINADTISGNKIVREILNQKAGFSFINKDEATNQSRELTIEKVVNKYSGLMTEIMNEISSTSKSLGYDIISVTYKQDDIDSINRVLSNSFGKMGDKRQIIQGNAFSSFNSGKISFTKLVLNVNSSSSIEIYRSLISDSTASIHIVPKSLFNQADFSKVTEYVLDITSLLILSKLKPKIDSENITLLVSQILIDYLEFKTQEVRHMPDEAMNLNITSLGVQPFFYPENYRAELLKQLSNLTSWISENCKIEFAPDKLDLLMKDPTLLDREDWHFQLCLDNLLIANRPNRSIISDDLMYFQEKRPFTNPLSVEHFLRIHKPDQLREYQLSLLEFNQVGLTLDSKVITQCFEENPMIESSNNLFRKAVNNLSFHKHGDPNLIYEVIVTVKNIYLLELERGFKQRLAQTLFTEALKGYPITLNSGTKFSEFIKKEFCLMGDIGLDVIDALTKSLEILNKSRNLAAD
ncbi:hypothetical protein SAMN04488029_0903 [Reichenbachiella faecimaris]|uniref:PIN domain-containing protein n=1 Tax=Reichenbachiella faecimaris TaxID=692418 RepID=A0A1W2G8D9_REIFA|nr:hypothetical protein [Reichenbachiella faecimaris]SMD32556.1 hypothetical protein SAMN04488029_0903 [Reichenbachiella faecimaris]